MIGQLKYMRRLFDGRWEITFATREDFTEEFDSLKDAPVKVEIKKAAQKRSNDANAYAWVLLDKLAEKTRIPKTEIYKDAIREIGGVSEMVCVQERAVKRLCSGWEKIGIGWQTEIIPSKLPGCKNVILYYGSSTYDSIQMSRLLDLIIQQCEQQGIPTLRDEADKLLQKWG